MNIPGFQLTLRRCVDVLMMSPRDAEAVCVNISRFYGEEDFKRLENDEWDEVDAMLRTTRVLLLAEGAYAAQA